MENTHEIINNLYIGNIKSLNHHKYFKFIINCCDDEEILNNIDKLIQENNNAVFLSLLIKNDHTESINFYNAIVNNNVLFKMHNVMQDYNNYEYDDIENDVNKSKILILCTTDQQRSCVLIACYLVKYYGMTPINAIKYIASRNPNAFFNNIVLIETINMIYNDSIKN